MDSLWLQPTKLHLHRSTPACASSKLWLSVFTEPMWPALPLSLLAKGETQSYGSSKDRARLCSADWPRLSLHDSLRRSRRITSPGIGSQNTPMYPVGHLKKNIFRPSVPSPPIKHVENRYCWSQDEQWPCSPIRWATTQVSRLPSAASVPTQSDNCISLVTPKEDRGV